MTDLRKKIEKALWTSEYREGVLDNIMPIVENYARQEVESVFSDIKDTLSKLAIFQNDKGLLIVTLQHLSMIARTRGIKLEE